jgi:ketosteroid isomerase-like protein
MFTPRAVILSFGLLFSTGAARGADANQARAEIERADAAFCLLAQKIGAAVAARAYAAPDATFLDTQPEVLHGPDAAALHLGGMPAGTVLQWKPLYAEAAASGDLGFSRGTYTLTLPAPDGTVHTQTGHYLTIWRRQADGTWKMIFDTGEPDAPPKK